MYVCMYVRTYVWDAVTDTVFFPESQEKSAFQDLISKVKVLILAL